MEFKVGQEVVFIGSDNPNPDIIRPKINDIVTIGGYSIFHKGNYYLLGYEKGKYGFSQSFRGQCLKPLDYQFVEEVEKMAKDEPILIEL